MVSLFQGLLQEKRDTVWDIQTDQRELLLAALPGAVILVVCVMKMKWNFSP